MMLAQEAIAYDPAQRRDPPIQQAVDWLHATQNKVPIMEVIGESFLMLPWNWGNLKVRACVCCSCMCVLCVCVCVCVCVHSHL
jgi:hypothetical protein